MMKTNYSNNVKGIRFNVMDDLDTLICKLNNKADAYYMDDVKCNIDKIEADIEKCEHAQKYRDKELAQRMVNEYQMLFKRYR